MSRSTYFFAAVAAFAATAATISFPAYAGEVTKTAAVKYADLNLASPAGAEALNKRVVRAAKQVCDVGDTRSLRTEADAQDCFKIAVARAAPQVELALANAGTQVAENSRVSVAAH